MVIFHSYDKLPEGNFFELNGWLVGGIPTPLKNIKVSWDDEIPNIWKHEKSNPPTSIYYYYYYIYIFQLLTMAHMKRTSDHQPRWHGNA